jgi:hypothetical protein
MLHVYRLSDGFFTGIAFDMQPRTPERIASHTPEGCAVMELTLEQQGRVRVDLKTGELAPYAAPSPSIDTLARLAEQVAREQRTLLLAASDWVVLRAADRGEAIPPEWAAYREALRALPEQPGFPTEIDWPVNPKENNDGT